MWPVGMLVAFSVILYAKRKRFFKGRAKGTVARSLSLLTGGFKNQ